MAYTTIDKPTDYFNTVLYTGNGSTNHGITGVGFQPDWVWAKQRSSTNSHQIYDSVRGATKHLSSDVNNAEQTLSEGLQSFDSDGFTVGNGTYINGSSATYASWNWLAGTSVSGSTGGSGTSKSYSGSVNTTSGFSIITYVGNGTAGHTIPHHLGSVPQVILLKGRDQVENWTVYHVGLTSNNYALRLNEVNAQFSQTLSWNNTTPTSSVFTVGGGAGTSDYTNRDGTNMIAYCFAEKKGFSRFASYQGSGNSNGVYIHLGFKPAWLMIKDFGASGDDWILFDNKRDTFNVANKQLAANGAGAEITGQTYNYIDFLSNGFKIRGSDGRNNGSGNSYIYMAFAENPFVSSTGIPCTAR